MQQAGVAFNGEMDEIYQKIAEESKHAYEMGCGRGRGGRQCLCARTRAIPRASTCGTSGGTSGGSSGIG